MKKTALIMLVMSLMLASFTAGVEYQRGDVDQNGIVNITDVSCLIDYLLKGTWPDEPVTPPDNHEWVDLGLPSGTLWAACNIGANNPEEYVRTILTQNISALAGFIADNKKSDEDILSGLFKKMSLYQMFGEEENVKEYNIMKW